MPREKYQTRLPDDTAKRVDAYNAEHGISQAEGVRRLIQAGLEAEAEDDETDDQNTKRAAQNATIYFIILVGLLTLNLVATLGLI